MIWKGDHYRAPGDHSEWASSDSESGGGGGGFETDSEIIGDDLRGRLEEGEWASGEALPSNSKLAKEYGTSRTTIARVMHKLAEDDLVEIIPRRGSFKR